MTARAAAPREGFPPVGGRDAELLILGSFPGVASLERREYYGFGRNRFWPLMERLFGVRAAAPYERRIAELVGRRVALWDVLAACDREGSRDDRILLDTAVPNEVARFVARHRTIRTVALNGGAAHRLFRRFVLASLGNADRPPRVVALPSTSPLNARMDLRALERSWRRGLAEGR